MRFSVIFLLVLLSLENVFAAPVELAPFRIFQGGVAVMVWGEEPPSEAFARYRGQTIPLRTDDSRRAGLLGCDIETPPGHYPVTVVLTDRRGRTRTQRLFLEVLEGSFPEERLTLPEAMVSPRDPDVVARIVAEKNLTDELFGRQSGGRRWTNFRPPVGDIVGSPFGRRRILNGKPRSPHGGVDFRSPAGTAVLASAGGRVAFAGDLFFTGLTVVLDHGEGLYSLYAHLQRIECREGDAVKKGQTLGLVGSSGRATGPHLHWGIKLRGDRIDPLALVDRLKEKKID